MADKLFNNKDLRTTFIRGLGLQFSWNYERMQALGYANALLPALKKIYKNDEDGLNKAVVRNLEFFNTQPYMAMPILGVSMAMEENLATEHKVDENAISSIKVALMGPLAGIGDSFFWFTLLPICAGVGVSLSTNGSILGPIVFLVLYNIVSIAVRWFGLTYGYKYGSEFVSKMSGNNVMQRLSEGATLVGLMVLGTMTATMVTVPLDFVIGKGDQAMSLQGIFDTIMPNLIPLLLVLGSYKLIKNGMSTTKVLFLIILIAIVGAGINIF
ncbi:MAG: PTS system mannose/fructose/sorbose family transporter subunit IID [Erysipelotrichaceae bacterium]|nr:PTS system mannose/fructose/sorbose family transporter subunit IID [Erysipelotrichaceae bacterium]MDY5251616.1 PTS system mannose/fructose/sorbose family transporter subunit IID [Erysipelotrichaceae bacterium]